MKVGPILIVFLVFLTTLTIIPLTYNRSPEPSETTDSGSPQIDLPPCLIQPDWNRETCYRDVTYSVTGLADLGECLYNIQSGHLPECPDPYGNEGWESACDCAGERDIICPITIPIGPGEVCNLVGEGTCKLCVKVVNTAIPPVINYGERAFNIDFEAPTTAIKCNDDECKPDTEWYDGNVKIALYCDDEDSSGCDGTYYCTDQTPDNPCVPATAYTEAFDVTSEGTNYVRFYSRDNAGNIETTRTQTVKLEEIEEEIEWRKVLITIAVIILIVLTIYFLRRQFFQKKK